MSIFETMVIFLTILGVWGSLWYKIGKLTDAIEDTRKEVEEHNKMLRGLQLQVGAQMLYREAKNGGTNELHSRKEGRDTADR